MRTRRNVIAMMAAVGVVNWLGLSILPLEVSAQEVIRKRVQAPAAGTQLPKPDPEFKGKIGETYKDSTPSYPPPLKAPQGAPNVLLVLLDDVGFGMCETYGGPVPTPQLDKLAKNGGAR